MVNIRHNIIIDDDLIMHATHGHVKSIVVMVKHIFSDGFMHGLVVY